MKLSEYLDLPGKTATKLAQDIGCSVSTITRAAKGNTLPSRKLADAIFEKTDGMVHPGSHYEVAA